MTQAPVRPFPLPHAREPFASVHAGLVGNLPEIPAIDLARYEETYLNRARAAWQERSRAEFRSMQVLIRFAGEIASSGDPLEMNACALEFAVDEIRQVELAEAICARLGIPATLPVPVPLVDPKPFLEAPPPERALHTAITSLLIGETLGASFAADLAARCDEPAVKLALEATIEEREAREEFASAYVAYALKRFHPDTMTSWRTLVDRVLAPHRTTAAKILETVPEAERSLERHEERDAARLGLFSQTRQALLFQEVHDDLLVPRLRDLGLLPETDAEPAH